MFNQMCFQTGQKIETQNTSITITSINGMMALK